MLFPLNSKGTQHLSIQTSTIQTPNQTLKFPKKYFNSGNREEIKSENWVRYAYMNFESLKSASEFASVMAIEPQISGAIKHKHDEASESSSQAQKTDSVKQAKELANQATKTDSVKLIAEKTISKTTPDLKTKINNTKLNKKNNYLFLRIIGNKNAAELKNDLILYGHKHIPLAFRRFYFRIVEKAYSYPIILLFILLIFFFTLNILMVLLVLYYSNQYKNYNDKYTRIFQKMYEDVLRSYLFGEFDWEKTLIKLKKIKRPLNRKILTTVLFNFQDNLRGEMDSQIVKIFVKLDLHKDALKSTKSSFYYNKIQGMRELTNLYPKVAEKIIQQYINDSNDLVRAEAQTSYIRLHPDKPFDFFRSLTSPFTRWTQLTAFYLFRLHQLPIPSFAQYMNSENRNVRNFCLRMITYFQQLENANEIYKMLESQLELTRYLSIHAINELRFSHGKDLIKKMYPVETPKNRIEIIRALINIGNAEDFDFLESIIHSDSVTLKTEACRSLYFMSKAGRERLIFLKQETDLKIEQYIEHITDPRN